MPVIICPTYILLRSCCKASWEINMIAIVIHQKNYWSSTARKLLLIIICSMFQTCGNSDVLFLESNNLFISNSVKFIQHISVSESLFLSTVQYPEGSVQLDCNLELMHSCSDYVNNFSEAGAAAKTPQCIHVHITETNTANVCQS